MSVTVRSNWSAQLLINYVTTEIRTLEPELYFANVGVRKDVPKGSNVLAFPQTSQIATTSVSSIGEGTNPTAITWGSTAYTASQTQQGLVIQVSDLLVQSSAIEVITAGVRQVKDAMLRSIDNLIQTTVNGGTNVLYAGGKASRAALGSGDIMDVTLLVKGVRNLRTASNAGLKPFEGKYYVAVLDPNVETDLMLNSSTGSFIDVGRYTSVSDLREGKMHDFRGARVLTSANVQTFSSTVTVHPITLLGHESFGWGYFQPLTPEIVMDADSNNPLNVFQSIGAKATLGATRFEEARIQRIECAVSA